MEGNDLELVEQARAGDSDAFRELVERHSRRMFGVAYRLTGSQENADDVVQESFLRAFRKLHLFDGRAQFGTWMYRITVNCSMDLMRKESKRMARETTEETVDLATLATGDPHPERLAQNSEFAKRVQQVLADLSPKERTAFVMRHIEGHSSVEIARLLDVRPGAIRHAVFRAIQKLRAALNPIVEKSHETSQG